MAGPKVPASAVLLVVFWAGCVSDATTGTGAPGTWATGAGALVGAGDELDFVPGAIGEIPGGEPAPDRFAGVLGDDDGPGELALRMGAAVVAVVDDAVVPVVDEAVVGVVACEFVAVVTGAVVAVVLVVAVVAVERAPVVAVVAVVVVVSVVPLVAVVVVV